MMKKSTEVTLMVSTVTSIFEEAIYTVAAESSGCLISKNITEKGVTDVEMTDDYHYTIPPCR